MSDSVEARRALLGALLDDLEADRLPVTHRALLRTLVAAEQADADARATAAQGATEEAWDWHDRASQAIGTIRRARTFLEQPDYDGNRMRENLLRLLDEGPAPTPDDEDTARRRMAEALSLDPDTGWGVLADAARSTLRHLAGARATLDHISKAMSWISGHDRQGLDHLDEAQYEAGARHAAVKQAQQWATRARAAEAALATELARQEQYEEEVVGDLNEHVTNLARRAGQAEAAIDRVRAQCAEWARPVKSGSWDAQIRDDIAASCAEMILQALDGPAPAPDDASSRRAELVGERADTSRMGRPVAPAVDPDDLDDPPDTHDWHHATPDAGLTCRRCLLAHKFWSGGPCPVEPGAAR